MLKKRKRIKRKKVRGRERRKRKRKKKRGGGGGGGSEGLFENDWKSNTETKRALTRDNYISRISLSLNMRVYIMIHDSDFLYRRWIKRIVKMI